MLTTVVLLLVCQICAADYPPFGREMREQVFMFADGYVNFNHASFGSPPREVIAARRQFEDLCESKPDVFFRGGYQKYFTEARAKLSKYLNAKEEDLVFVENTSSGINAVLRSARLQPGDVILELSIAYGMVKNTLNYLSDLEGIEIEEVAIVFPGKSQPPTGVLGSIYESVESALIKHDGKIKLVSFCHISSTPTVILPIANLATLCKRYGASVLIDGAHALGQIPVDLTALEAAGVDYWIGNGHKWLYSPKGSALLWVSKSKQTSVIPTVISSSFTIGPADSDYQNNFLYTGTRDYTPFCAMSAALDFRTAVGEDKIMEYNHELVVWAQAYLAQLWGTEVLLPETWIGMMGNVRLPIQVQDVDKMSWLSKQLLDVYNIQFSVFNMTNVVTKEESFWARLSAQIYLEQSDFTRMGNAVLELLKD